MPASAVRVHQAGEAATLRPIMKNVAGARRASRASRSFPLSCGEGPSSKVRASALRREASGAGTGLGRTPGPERGASWEIGPGASAARGADGFGAEGSGAAAGALAASPGGVTVAGSKSAGAATAASTALPSSESRGFASRAGSASSTAVCSPSRSAAGNRRRSAP